VFIGQYILDDDGNPQPEPDSLKWAMWFEDGNRIVQQDHIGDAFVSTVFLGLDHRYGGDGPPILWETMVFQGTRTVKFPDGKIRTFKEEQYQRRYTSRKDALRGHKRAVKFVMAKQKDLQELERMAEAGGWVKK
jgi:hypothetical protein